MNFDKDVVAAKLRRWEKYLYNYQLPYWDEIPNVGFYMEQVVGILKEYLDYMPPEIHNGNVITAASINNCVRLKCMPGTINKKYYRLHIAYLIMIFSLRQTLGMATIQKLISSDIPEEDFREQYDHYVDLHQRAAQYFTERVRESADPIVKKEDNAEQASEDFVYLSAIVGGFAQLLSEKMLLLDGLTPDSPGIELSIPERKRRARRKEE